MGDLDKKNSAGILPGPNGCNGPTLPGRNPKDSDKGICHPPVLPSVPGEDPRTAKGDATSISKVEKVAKILVTLAGEISKHLEGDASQRQTKLAVTKSLYERNNGNADNLGKDLAKVTNGEGERVFGIKEVKAIVDIIKKLKDEGIVKW